MRPILHTAYIGLGSNLSLTTSDDVLSSQQIIEQALQQLSHLSEPSPSTHSSLYISKPVGPQDQADFVNAVICIETALTPLALLHTLQSMEKKAGRIKTRHWGERTLDLDILWMFDTQTGELMISNTLELTLPHPEIFNRSFVVIPALQIDPSLTVNDVALRSLPTSNDPTLIKLNA